MEVEKKDHDLSVLECRFDECKNRLRGLFNQVLMKYLERKNVHLSMEPLPTLCSYGKPVDLFKLFWVVRKLGGYDSTSRQDLWGFVAEECGLGAGVMASVKLIYTKYLSELDRWLWQGVKDGEYSNGGGNRLVKNLEEMLRDLMKEFGDLNGMWKRRISDVKVVLSDIGNCGDGSNSRNTLASKESNELFDSLENDEQIYVDSDNNLVVSTKQVIEKVVGGVHGFQEQRGCEDGKKLGSIPPKKAMVISIGSSAHDTANVKVAKGDFNPPSNDRVAQVDDSRKRKREHSPWAQMLSWVKGTAKFSDDIGICRIPGTSKWKGHGFEELWVQALSARKALSIKRHNFSAESSSQQGKISKMHPSMYEEDVSNNLSVEKSRVSLRLQLAKSVRRLNTQERSPPKQSPFLSVDIASCDTVNRGLLGNPSKKGSRIEPCYQAEIPEWTGKASESDSKWLRTQIWPSEEVGHKAFPECDPIGKGRPKTCSCLFPGHIECIRFHIAEKRLNLNRELKEAFHKWRFHHMGEEVSLSWTEEEEKRFKEMMESNIGTWNRFWHHALKIFPTKTREELVSYYFNVYIIGRRSYQNRVNPEDVDSDDDEKEVGSVGDCIRSKAIYVPQLSLPVCIENKQCFELE